MYSEKYPRLGTIRINGYYFYKFMKVIIWYIPTNSIILHSKIIENNRTKRNYGNDNEIYTGFDW